MAKIFNEQRKKNVKNWPTVDFELHFKNHWQDHQRNIIGALRQLCRVAFFLAGRVTMNHCMSHRVSKKSSDRLKRKKRIERWVCARVYFSVCSISWTTTHKTWFINREKNLQYANATFVDVFWLFDTHLTIVAKVVNCDSKSKSVNYQVYNVQRVVL